MKNLSLFFFSGGHFKTTVKGDCGVHLNSSSLLLVLHAHRIASHRPERQREGKGSLTDWFTHTTSALAGQPGRDAKGKGRATGGKEPAGGWPGPRRGGPAKGEGAPPPVGPPPARPPRAPAGARGEAGAPGLTLAATSLVHCPQPGTMYSAPSDGSARLGFAWCGALGCSRRRLTD